jgi:arginyl-tRNA synthetase
MRIRQLLANKACEAVYSLYQKDFPAQKVQVQKTRPEFEGDLTIVVFPFLQISKKSPEQTAEEIGAWLKANLPEVSSFNVIKGFLNLVIDDKYWLNALGDQSLLAADKSQISRSTLAT